jgi:hypothetical protein
LKSSAGPEREDESSVETVASTVLGAEGFRLETLASREALLMLLMLMVSSPATLAVATTSSRQRDDAPWSGAILGPVTPAPPPGAFLGPEPNIC